MHFTDGTDSPVFLASHETADGMQRTDIPQSERISSIKALVNDD